MAILRNLLGGKALGESRRTTAGTPSILPKPFHLSILHNLIHSNRRFKVDTISLSRRLFGATRGTRHSLDAVLRRLDLDVSKYRRHDARGDIMALADSVKIMWERLDLDHHGSGLPRRQTSLPAF